MRLVATHTTRQCTCDKFHCSRTVTVEDHGRCKAGDVCVCVYVGETGLGKSTLLRSLFLNNDLYDGRSVPPAEGNHSVVPTTCSQF